MLCLCALWSRYEGYSFHYTYLEVMYGIVSRPQTAASVCWVRIVVMARAINSKLSLLISQCSSGLGPSLHRTQLSWYLFKVILILVSAINICHSLVPTSSLTPIWSQVNKQHSDHINIRHRGLFRQQVRYQMAKYQWRPVSNQTSKVSCSSSPVLDPAETLTSVRVRRISLAIFSWRFVRLEQGVAF